MNQQQEIVMGWFKVKNCPSASKQTRTDLLTIRCNDTNVIVRKCVEAVIHNGLKIFHDNNGLLRIKPRRTAAFAHVFTLKFRENCLAVSQ